MCGPLQAFTTLVQSMVRVFKLEPEPSKAHVLLEIADGICQSISCCYTTLANSNIAVVLNALRPSTSWQHVAERLLKSFGRFCWDSCLP